MTNYYTDAEGVFFGRVVNPYGDIGVFHVEDGEAATRMDCPNLYPVDSDMGVQYEHPQGIVISRRDADRIGLTIEK